MALSHECSPGPWGAAKTPAFPAPRALLSDQRHECWREGDNEGHGEERRFTSRHAYLLWGVALLTAALSLGSGWIVVSA